MAKTYYEILKDSLIMGLLVLVIGEIVARSTSFYGVTRSDVAVLRPATDNYMLEIGLFITGFFAQLIYGIILRYMETRSL